MDKADIKSQQQKFELLGLTYENSHFKKGDEDLKNVRKRADGRYEWRKQINGIKYQIINKNKKILEQSARAMLKRITINKDTTKSKTFIELAWHWYETYKKPIKTADKYEHCLKSRFANNAIFNQSINKLNYEQLEYFINSIKEHRVASYCYFIISGVYKEALKRDLIKKDISQLITKPKNKSVKGEWFSIEEQKLLLSNLDKTTMANEILFYLMTGCRRAEATTVELKDINFERLTVYINGTKTKMAKRYVPISQRYADVLKTNFDKMFKCEQSYYSKLFQQYLEKLNIKNHKLHDLRHTFATNLFYLGVPDKQRQYYLGHSSIVITNDIYTSIDPNVARQDILNLYKDLYPNF